MRTQSMFQPVSALRQCELQQLAMQHGWRVRLQTCTERDLSEVLLSRVEQSALKPVSEMLFWSKASDCPHQHARSVR